MHKFHEFSSPYTQNSINKRQKPPEKVCEGRNKRAQKDQHNSQRISNSRRRRLEAWDEQQNVKCRSTKRVGLVFNQTFIKVN